MLRIPLLHVLQNALEISWKLSETIDSRIECNLHPMDSRLLVVVYKFFSVFVSAGKMSLCKPLWVV